MGRQLLGFFSSTGDAGVSSLKRKGKDLLFFSRIVSPQVLEWGNTGEGGRWGDSKPKEPATLSKLCAFLDAPSYWPKYQ